MICSDCGKSHDPAIRCPNYHAGMHPKEDYPMPKIYTVRLEVPSGSREGPFKSWLQRQIANDRIKVLDVEETK